MIVNGRLFTSYKAYDGGHVVFRCKSKGKISGGEDDRIIEPVVQDPVRSLSLEANALEPDYPKCVKEAKGHLIEQVIGELNARTLRSKTKQA
ncbi:hypothetical protein Tco_1005444 [Tanacetum coccineum]|uniref:Uncharacterized protein n=1 Tax=Tanacetum coccineum TaxID=301880 RepID=A0ABQ5FEQ2_9ASTR